MSFRFSSFSSFLSYSRVLSILCFFSCVLISYHPFFLFHLVPKISGRDLLLVEKCCNTPDPMRQVSSSYSSLLPCLLLACYILPCHHVHCIAYVFVSSIRAFSPLSILRSGTPMSSGALFCFLSCAGVKRSRTRPRFAMQPW